MSIIMFTSKNNPDYINYLNWYEDTSLKKDIGFDFIRSIFRFFNFSYDGFLFFITLTIFIILLRALSNFKVKDKILFFLLILIYPFFLDLVQIRNFLAQSIVILAISGIKKIDFHNFLKFTITVIIATTIQISSIVYLFFGLIFLVYKKLNTKLILIIGITIAIIAISTNLIEQVGIVLNLLFNDARFEEYFVIKTEFGYFIYYFIQLIGILISYYSYKYNTGQEKALSFKIYLLNLISILFIPLYILQTTLFRVYRNMIPLLYISVLKNNDKQRKYYMIIALLVYSLALFIFEILLYHYDTILKPLLMF